MDTIILCIVVVIVVGLLLYCVDLLPALQPPTKNILKILLILVGVLWLVNRTGLLH